MGEAETTKRTKRTKRRRRSKRARIEMNVLSSAQRRSLYNHPTDLSFSALFCVQFPPSWHPLKAQGYSVEKKSLTMRPNISRFLTRFTHLSKSSLTSHSRYFAST